MTPGWSPAPRPLRIVEVAACPYPTTQGTQVHLRGLVRALSRRGHDVHVVTYHFGEDLPHDGGTIHRIPRVPGYGKLRAGPSLGKPLLDALLLGRLAEVVRSVRPDLVHVHNYEGPWAGYAVRALTGVPVVYTAHNLMSDELELYLDGRRARAVARAAAWALDRSVPRLADRCIAISAGAAAVLPALGVAPERLALLPPAIHAEDLGPEPPPAGAAPPVVVYTGNPDRYQDLGLLFAAMARVRQQRPDATLRVVSGAQLGPLEEQALGLGLAEGVRFVRTSDWAAVREELVGARTTALPRSLCRGAPIKLLNYQGLGRPVVACAGSAHGVSPATGIRVPNGDVDAFAQGLLAVIEDPALATRMGRAARTSILQNALWQDRVERLEREFDTTIAACAGRRPAVDAGPT